ncbi:MAG TPA: hypothetical protein VK542_04675 [Gemmatimonadaceae bacterium]|nr:hypothetical protein [Gemmatimonadaceae bacterium]
MLWLTVCGCVVLPGIADAQEEPPPVWTTDRLMVGFHYGFPLKWSGVIAAQLPASFRNNKAFIAAEPGIGGWRASVGAYRLTSDLGSGYVARASFLRTNGNAWRTSPNSSFAGAEFQFMPIFITGVRVGGFVRLGQRSGPRGLFTADISLML